MMYDHIQKTIVAWIFNNYIAHYYFDNVNVNQLKVAFEKGEIELENLPLKKNALQHLKVPWDIVQGTISKLRVRIPGLTLLTDPCVVELEGLVLVVSPRSKLSRIQLSGSGIDENNDDGEFNINGQNQGANTEEARLAEFYRLFSDTVSSTFKDFFGNIKLEIISIELIFENFQHEIVKMSADHLLLYKPETQRKLVLKNVALFLSSMGSHRLVRKDDLIKLEAESCNLEVRDVSCNSNQTSLEIISETDISGNLFISGSSGAPSTPVAKFLLEDFRMLYFSGNQQQDGSIFARLSCFHLNQGTSSWDPFLEPWPFNLSWDKRVNHRRISITSDETAELTLTSSLVDLIDVILKRVLKNPTRARMWSAVRNSSSKTHKKAFEASPRDAKLIYYNYNTNLAQQIGARSTRQLFADRHRQGISDINFKGLAIRMTLLDDCREKIVVIFTENVLIKSTTRSKEQIIDCSIQDVRIENALEDCEQSTVLDRASISLNDTISSNPAFRLIMDRILGRSYNTVWFKQVQITICELVMNIEEKLFLKLVEFISFRNRELRREKNHQQRSAHTEEDRQSKYYFDLLRIDLSGLKLSVYAASSLPYSLQKIKSCLGLKFFGFEDAQVQLAPYFRMNVSRNMRGIYESVTRFYMRQISEQAPRIVGQQIQNYLSNHLSDLLSSFYDEVYNKLFY